MASGARLAFVAMATATMVIAASMATSLIVWGMMPARLAPAYANATTNAPMPAAPQVVERVVYVNVSEGRLEDEMAAAIMKVRPSVVYISSVSKVQLLSGKAKVTSSGSGFVWTASGLVITNAHVVENATTVTLMGSDGAVFNGTVIGRDSDTDIALVKIASNRTFTPVEFGDSDAVRPGQFVMTMGSPYKLMGSATFGVVSGLNRTFQVDEDSELHNIIQTDAAINPGNSGGPLLNLRGQVIGVNSALISKSGGFEGISFAIPSKMAREIAGELLENGRIIRPWMGITLRGIDDYGAETLNLTVNRGILVLDVVKGSPAEQAGLKGTLVKKDMTEVIPGDVITEFNGSPIEGVDDLLTAIGKTRPGDSVLIRYYRGGNRTETTLNIGEKPQD